MLKSAFVALCSRYTLPLNLRSRWPGPEADLEVHRPGPGRPVVRPPPLPRQGLGRAAPEDAAHHDRLGGVRPLHHGGWCLELETNPREVCITEKASTKAFSWLKAPTSAFTFKTQC